MATPGCSPRCQRGPDHGACPPRPPAQAQKPTPTPKHAGPGREQGRLQTSVQDGTAKHCLDPEGHQGQGEALTAPTALTQTLSGAWTQPQPDPAFHSRPQLASGAHARLPIGTLVSAPPGSVPAPRGAQCQGTCLVLQGCPQAMTPDPGASGIGTESQSGCRAASRAPGPTVVLPPGPGPGQPSWLSGHYLSLGKAVSPARLT